MSTRASLAHAFGPGELGTSPAPQFFARNVYRDAEHAIDTAKLLPGEYYVATRAMMLTTVLGSCVAACIRDVRLGIGGMNHFMLPDSDASGPMSSSARYGTYAMEILINHLLKLGARRENLEAKVFGGGNVLPGLTMANVGQRNADFVVDYLRTEQLRIVARDLVDVFPRKVNFFPATGRVLVKRLKSANTNELVGRESDYRKRIGRNQDASDVELFN